MRNKKPLEERQGIQGDMVVKAPYVPPKILTYDKDQIIDILGPAMACPSAPECVDVPI